VIRHHLIALLLARGLVGLLLSLLAATGSHGADVLTPVGAVHRPIRIADHQGPAALSHGFTRIEVAQNFVDQLTGRFRS
jgi:hypothetical protein